MKDGFQLARSSLSVWAGQSVTDTGAAVRPLRFHEAHRLHLGSRGPQPGSNLPSPPPRPPLRATRNVSGLAPPPPLLSLAPSLPRYFPWLPPPPSMALAPPQSSLACNADRQWRFDASCATSPAIPADGNASAVSSERQWHRYVAVRTAWRPTKVLGGGAPSKVAAASASAPDGWRRRRSLGLRQHGMPTTMDVRSGAETWGGPLRVSA